MDKENWFEVPGRLPSLNDYINACRSHWSKGMQMKRETEEEILWAIKAARSRKHLQPASGPVVVHFEWHEADKRRDLDNIYSAKKYILDAMQRAGIIKNDNRQHVRGLYDTIVDDDRDGVVVTILDVESNGSGAAASIRENHKEG